MEGLKTVGTRAGHVPGGPIPPGTYYTIKRPVANHHLGLSTELVPRRANMMGQAASSFTAAAPWQRWPHRPSDHHQFHQLMDALSASNGGNLVVAERMGGERFAYCCQYS